jgi:hypothetical protein
MNNTSSKSEDPGSPDLTNRWHRKELSQLCVSALLSFVMFLLFANIVLLWIGSTYNSRVCHDAIIAGARAASEGADDEIIVKVVEYSVETASKPGLFIAHPELHFVKFGFLHGAKCLVVNTVTRAKIPAPLLVINSDRMAIDHGFIVFSKTYVLNLIASKDPKA